MSTTIKKLLPKKWQDAVFFVGEIVFLTSLIPVLWSPHKPPWGTSLATAFMLYTFLLVHRSYKLWFTFSLTLVTASIWLTLGLQMAP